MLCVFICQNNNMSTEINIKILHANLHKDKKIILHSKQFSSENIVVAGCWTGTGERGEETYYENMLNIFFSMDGSPLVLRE